MNREDIKIYMLCRYYIYKAFYIVFSAPLSVKSAKELLDEKIKQSFLISERIYNMSELYKFLSKLLSEVSDEFLSRPLRLGKAPMSRKKKYSLATRLLW